MSVHRRPLPVLLLVLASTLASGQTSSSPTVNLGVAEYDAEGRLRYPDNSERWILMGANLGGDYAEAAFDPAHPGNIGVVQMEPAAYEYFIEHGEYADGSQFLLTFYAAERKSEPQLQGFVQGRVTGREIHVLDQSRFAEGRAFFFYREGEDLTAPLPPGNDCVSCHHQEGDYNGTFTQFYPLLRDFLSARDSASE